MARKAQGRAEREVGLGTPERNPGAATAVLPGFSQQAQDRGCVWLSAALGAQLSAAAGFSQSRLLPRAVGPPPSSPLRSVYSAQAPPLSPGRLPLSLWYGGWDPPDRLDG